MTKHTLKTVVKSGDHPGKFSGTQTLRIAGSSRAGGPGGWKVGGWDETTKSRPETGGPMVPGPVAYIFGLCAVLSSEPLEREEEVYLEAGDVLKIDGEEYVLSLVRGYPKLSLVEV